MIYGQNRVSAISRSVAWRHRVNFEIGSNELANWAQVAAALFAAVGLFLTAFQIRRAVQQRRIERVDNVRQALYGDDALLAIYYRIEYQDFTYTKDFHLSDEEKQLDKLLSMFDSLASQVQSGLLTVQDLDLLGYEYIVTYQDKEVQCYLEFLDEWFKERGIRRIAFKAYRNVGKQLELAGYGASNSARKS